MSYFKLPQTAFALGLLAGFCALAGPARAADLDVDPAYADVPAPIPQQQVTFGSGWYVRGDIAATESYKVEIGRPDQIRRTQNASFDATLGGGYAFTNSVRADVTADFFQPTQTCVGYSQQGSCNNLGQLQRYAGLVNGYYDLGTWSVVTPYVGAGVGAAFLSKKNDIGARQNVTTFAFALMAGLSFDVYPHVKLDVGYRYINEGSVFGANVYDHQIRAGLRYMIDN